MYIYIEAYGLRPQNLYVYVYVLSRLEETIMKRSGVRTSVCPVGMLTVTTAITRQGAACDAVSVHFGPTIKRIDLVVLKNL